MSLTVSLASSAPDGGSPLRWTRTDYHRLAELGLLPETARYELVAGEIVVKMPQNFPHSATVLKLPSVLTPVFLGIGHVRPQVPVALSTDGEPEPDLAVVGGGPESYSNHPTEEDILLLIEVSDTTLSYDLGRKAAYYAEAGIRDYWVLDVNAREVHVLRNPAPDPRAPWGHRYRSTQTLSLHEQITPLAAMSTSLSVAALFP